MSKKQDMKELALFDSLRSAVRASDCDAVGLEVKNLTVRVRHGEVELVERSTESGVGFVPFMAQLPPFVIFQPGEPGFEWNGKEYLRGSELLKPWSMRVLADPVGYAGGLDLELWDPDASALSVDVCVWSRPSGPRLRHLQWTSG